MAHAAEELLDSGFSEELVDPLSKQRIRRGRGAGRGGTARFFCIFRRRRRTLTAFRDRSESGLHGRGRRGIVVLGGIMALRGIVVVVRLMSKVGIHRERSLVLEIGIERKVVVSVMRVHMGSLVVRTVFHQMTSQSRNFIAPDRYTSGVVRVGSWRERLIEVGHPTVCEGIVNSEVEPKESPHLYSPILRLAHRYTQSGPSH